jgi:hypothetical protein
MTAPRFILDDLTDHRFNLKGLGGSVQPPTSRLETEARGLNHRIHYEGFLSELAKARNVRLIYSLISNRGSQHKTESRPNRDIKLAMTYPYKSNVYHPGIQGHG